MDMFALCVACLTVFVYGTKNVSVVPAITTSPQHLIYMANSIVYNTFVWLIIWIIYLTR